MSARRYIPSPATATESAGTGGNARTRRRGVHACQQHTSAACARRRAAAIRVRRLRLPARRARSLNSGRSTTKLVGLRGHGDGTARGHAPALGRAARTSGGQRNISGDPQVVERGVARGGVVAKWNGSAAAGREGSVEGLADTTDDGDAQGNESPRLSDDRSTRRGSGEKKRYHGRAAWRRPRRNVRERKRAERAVRIPNPGRDPTHGAKLEDATMGTAPHGRRRERRTGNYLGEKTSMARKCANGSSRGWKENFPRLGGQQELANEMISGVTAKAIASCAVRDDETFNASGREIRATPDRGTCRRLEKNRPGTLGVSHTLLETAAWNKRQPASHDLQGGVPTHLAAEEEIGPGHECATACV
ncbi:hypothetical protein DFH09DRAFT_1087474 [Mycena vulgaris]|nr:hypothetical protein DFH09DRAFT_1087474 [Mycena vulgaris]